MNININKNDHSINEYLYCFKSLDTIPSSISLYNTYDKNDIELILNSFKIITSKTDIIPSIKSNIENIRFLLMDEKSNIYVSYTLYDNESESGFISDIIFYFKESSREDVMILVEKLESIINEEDADDTDIKVNVLTLTSEGLSLEPIDIPESKYDLDIIYSKRVVKDYKSLLTTLNKTKKGISILYGERGVGKTNLIKQLISNLKKNIIVVPINMVDTALNSNDFKLMLKLKETIVIMDDCEIYFSGTHMKSNLYTNNLIQFVDGISSDSYNVNFILGLNIENIENIDSDLLNCNNFISEIEIEKLSEDKIHSLCKHLGIKNKFKDPTTLSDIFNKRKSKKKEKEVGY